MVLLWTDIMNVDTQI